MDFIQALIHNCLTKTIDHTDQLSTKANVTKLQVNRDYVEITYNEKEFIIKYNHALTRKELTRTYTKINTFIEGLTQVCETYGNASNMRRILSGALLHLKLGND